MFDRSSFLADIEVRGCSLIDGLLGGDLIQQCREGLLKAIDGEARYHGTTDYPDYGMVQCCAMYDRVFIDLLDHEELMEPLNLILGDGCIVYASFSSSLPPDGANFASRIHVDSPRLIPGYHSNFVILILLDDFTEENGATWFLPGSHNREESPSEDEFYSKAERLVARAGSAWYFDPRLWHAADKNRTDGWRHSFGFNMCRPYMKQRFDVPRLMSDVDLEGVSENARQKLGFHAQAPTSLDEYYAPLDQRMFRQPYE